MVKVVGEDTEMIKRTSCRKCAARLEYTLSEVRQSKHYDYTGDCDIVNHITCPKCGDEVCVKGY